MLFKKGDALRRGRGERRTRRKGTELLRRIALGGLLLALLGFGELAKATPSTAFYTPCTTYIQPFKVPHLTYDSYFNDEVDFPTDVGLAVGLLPWEKFQAEAGFDLFLPSEYPWQFNARAGVPDDALFKNSPGINLGIWGMGTEDDVNNFDILQLNVGKTIPKIGSIAAGIYKGLNEDLLEDENGNDQSLGWMVSYYRTLEPFTDRIGVSADYMSGKNIFSGGGVGAYFWFTKFIDLILGWVWFENQELNPKSGLFTIQLDVDLDFARSLEAKDRNAAPPGSF